MLLGRAIVLVSKMPKLDVKDITKEEAYELWEFLDEERKLPITKTRLKINLAKECGVFVEQLDAVANGASLAEVLIMESSDSKTSKLKLKEIKSIIQSVTSDEEWIIPFCHSMDITEAEFVWRWALNERWRSLRYRMKKWAKINSKINDDLIDTFEMLDVIFGLRDKQDVERPTTEFKRLQAWNGINIPDKYWFVNDCGTLMFLENNVARNRNGEINREYTPQVQGIDTCWCWVDVLGTTRLHSIEQDVPFSIYKEPMGISWHEANKILYNYPKGGFLILNDNDYHLYTKGTNALIVQALSVRRIKNVGYEFILGVKDGTDIIDVDKMLVESIPFELENALKRNSIPVQNSHTNHDIPFVVIEVAYSWRAEDGWGWRYITTLDDASISEIDEYTTYISMVGVDNE